MLDKLAAVANRFEELCARSEQPDFFADPKKAAAILRERNDLELIQLNSFGCGLDALTTVKYRVKGEGAVRK